MRPLLPPLPQPPQSLPHATTSAASSAHLDASCIGDAGEAVRDVASGVGGRERQKRRRSQSVEEEAAVVVATLATAAAARTAATGEATGGKG